MFIWDFVIDVIMGEFIDWLYAQMVGTFGLIFSFMGQMSVEMFDLNWVQSLVLFFRYLAWALFVVGLVVSGFEFAIEYQTGRASLRDTALNAIKGFLAALCFTTVPIELYKLSLTLQDKLIMGMTSFGNVGALAQSIMNQFNGKPGEIDLSSIFTGWVNNPILNPGGPGTLLVLFIVIMIAYATLKVFFSCLKRGGILLIQIAVGSLYMFSVPRGYLDGFMQWCKQVIALCLTSFLQVLILTGGLLTLKDNPIIGLGVMLSAGEIPRIAGAFGLDTSAKASLGQVVNTAHMAANTVKTVQKVVTTTAA